MPSRSRVIRSRPMLVVAALLGGGLALGPVPSPATAAPDREAAATTKALAPSVTWDHCSSDVPKGRKCGHIRVARDPLRPELGKQTVAFEYYPRRDRARPSLGTLVAQEGGPGYPTTGSRDWYLGLFKPMQARHDVLLVDERGTGKSGVIRCQPLQHGTMAYEKAVAACGKQLGERADSYTTAYGADDMAQVLDALGINRIDLYGDSYGTFFSQVFALRHPGRLRTLVLDASYPVSDQDPWYRDTNRAIQDAVTRVCARDPKCAALGGSALTRLAAAGQALHQHPVVGRAPDADGSVVKVHLNGVNLGLITANATYGTSIYRELDAAVRAYRHGYPRPLMRIVAENLLIGDDNGAATDFSAGEYAAVICNDYPQLWDVTLPPGKQRQQQYVAAVADLEHSEPDAFYPFRLDDWVKGGWGEPHTCIGWPSPTDPLPPEEPGAVYPSVPTLVLSGDLDSVTSPEGGRIVTSRFPDATFVSVPNIGHVTAIGDLQGCAAGIVRHFVRSGGTVGDTSCVRTAYAPVRTVPRFARTSAGLDPVHQGVRVKSSAADRRVVAGAVAAVGDVFSRWYINYSGAGSGLWGGTYSYTGDNLTRFTLKGYRFTTDVGVTGSVRWNRHNGQVTATVRVNGPRARDGRLTISYDDWTKHAQGHVTGRIGGRAVDLRTPAP